MTARKLTAGQERSLVMDYLLGVEVSHLCEQYGMHRSTFYRTLERLGVETSRKKGSTNPSGGEESPTPKGVRG